jgi:hypothetical protein
MPQLKNIRHERFCQIWPRGKLQGMSQGQIYQLAGFSTKSEHSAETMASRLMQRPDIRNRIGEISQFSVTKAQIDVDNLLSKTERVYHQAVEDREHGSANKAVELQGKLSGNLVDRVEIDAHVGGFRGAKTSGELYEMLIDVLGEGDLDKALAGFDQIREGMIARAADKAKLVEGASIAFSPLKTADDFRPDENAAHMSRSAEGEKPAINGHSSVPLIPTSEKEQSNQSTEAEKEGSG